MVSTWMMVALLVAYAAIFVTSLLERHWWRACYWLGAMFIMVAVLGMARKPG